MLKAVLLDIDGTLVASNDAHARAWSQALQAHGYDVPASTIVRWIGMGGDKILPRVDPSLRNDREPGTSIEALRGRIFLERYVSDLKQTDGAAALLQALRARGLLCVAATSAKKVEFEAITRVTDLERYIDLATTSDDADHSKPDPDIVASALSKSGSNASTAIYLGDTPYDAAAARSAGVASIVVRCGGWNDDELPDADEIYDSPADLCANLDASLIGKRK